MAYSATHSAPFSDLPHRVLNGVRSAVSSIGQTLIAASTANRRLQAVERLNAMSDAKLSELGIRREDIVRKVFIDMLDI